MVAEIGFVFAVGHIIDSEDAVVVTVSIYADYNVNSLIDYLAIVYDFFIQSIDKNVWLLAFNRSVASIFNFSVKHF